MLPNKEGQRVPEVTFPVLVDGQLRPVSTNELFAGKTVLLFSLPGAYTPTCSSAHVPRYQELAPLFEARGVDEIICMSVNDPFVMAAWQRDQAATAIRFIPDGNGAFTKAMGLLVDKRDLGFGERSWRYAMLVRDGVIEKMFIEPEVEGDPYEVSDADTMLRYLDPGASTPDDIVLLTKPGCGHCARAKSVLDERGLPYAELVSDERTRRAVAGNASTPQVFINGEHIGGADQLIARLEG